MSVTNENAKSLLELLGVDADVCLLIKLDWRRGSGVANDGSFQF